MSEKPRIVAVDIVQDDIEHRMPLGEFKQILKKEMGSVTFMTQRQYEKRIDSAIDRIVQRIRDEKAQA